MAWQRWCMLPCLAAGASSCSSGFCRISGIDSCRPSLDARRQTPISKRNLEGGEYRSIEAATEAMPAYGLGPATYALHPILGGTRCDAEVHRSRLKDDGRRDQDFCIVSDTDLHINAHFIGNHNPANERTFTWIQAIGVSFGDHSLYVGPRKVVEWDEDEDHIEITLDGEPVNIDTANNAGWVSKVLAGLSVKRIDNVNSVTVDLAGVFSISASAVPISDEESEIHSYGKTMKDSLVHLDLRFKFHSLTNNVDGVLGQTYRTDYINKMNVTAKMPIMGGAPKYLSSGLFSTDCAVSKFHRNAGGSHVLALAA